MAGGLRYETGREMPPGMQELMAKRFVEQLKQNAVQNAVVMAEVLKKVDVDCEFCKNAGGNTPCNDDSIAFSCDGCAYDCPCNGCRENSKYEWCGADEALNRLGLMQR